MRLDHYSLAEEQQAVKQSFCRSLRRDTHWKCLILSLLIFGCLTAIGWCRLTTFSRPVLTQVYDMHFYHHPVSQSSSSPCEDGYIYIPVAFVVMLYLVYLVECWHCHTRIELQYKVDVNTVYEKISAMRESLPVVWWKAVCYHYVRRTRQVTRYRNGDAFTTTQVYYERVNSHTASSAFNFSNCGIKDISKNLINLEQFPATKIKFSKGFSFATLESEHEFEDQRAHFFQDHERRDDYMETREGLDLMNVNFKEYMIAFADPDNLPWYVSHVVFWILSVLMLSWPLRVLIEYKTAYVHYHVHKLFGCNYLDPAYCPTPGMTRVSTMESSELEMNIRNNYTMVPSYSEALLMDANCPTTQDANGNSITPSVSFHSGYIHIPGNITPRMYQNDHVSSGYVAGGGVVITNGVAHAVSGPIPMSLSNGHIPNGSIGNGSIANGTISNGNPFLGGVPAFVMRQGETGQDGAVAFGRRRKRKRKRHRRHSYTDPSPIHTDSQLNGASQSTMQILTHSSTTAVASTTESPTSEQGVTIANPTALDNSPAIPPSESCPNVLEHNLTTDEGLDTHDEIDGSMQSNADLAEGENIFESNRLPHSDSTVTEAPPSYELALNMRIPLPAVISDSRPPSSPPIRLMETSL